MRELRFDRSFIVTMAIGIAVIDLLVVGYGLAFGFRRMAREDGLLELAQLVALAVSAIGFIALIPRVRHGGRIVASGAAALSILFFFREFETPINNPVLDFMSNDPFLYLLSVMLGIFVIWQIAANWTHVPAFLGWLARLGWWPWLAAGAMLIIGSAFEAMHMMFLEELFELNADAVFAIIAVTALGRTVGSARSPVGAHLVR